MPHRISSLTYEQKGKSFFHLKSPNQAIMNRNLWTCWNRNVGLWHTTNRNTTWRKHHSYNLARPWRKKTFSKGSEFGSLLILHRLLSRWHLCLHSYGHWRFSSDSIDVYSYWHRRFTSVRTDIYIAMVIESFHQTVLMYIALDTEGSYQTVLIYIAMDIDGSHQTMPLYKK